MFIVQKTFSVVLALFLFLKVTFSRFGFPDGRIFFVNEKGKLRCYNRGPSIGNYRELSELTNEIFPEIPRGEYPIWRIASL